MNEKTTRQIEEMKKQTIGVEIEMNSITRERQQRLQPPTSEQEDFRIRQAGTDTTLGQHGMNRAGNGNSRRMSALPDATAKNANW